MAHSHHMHREQQVAHRRVGVILKGEPAGAKQHFKSPAFSKVTSKSAAAGHDDAHIGGRSQPKRFARGGAAKHSDVAEDKKLIKKMLVEHEKSEGEGEGYARGGRTKGKGHQTNIAIVVPHHGQAGPGAGPGSPGGPIPGPGGPPPMPPPMAGPGGPPPMAGGPPGLPPGMPMRASGGRIEGEATKANLKSWSKRASANSYFRGGAATGVGREEKAEHMRRKRK